jgi:hypothetical protein
MALTLADLWQRFADVDCAGTSPIYQQIARTVARDDAVLAMVADAPPATHFPPVLLAAVHFLLLGGLDHPLGAVYRGESDEDPGPRFVDLVIAHRDELVPVMVEHHINTNEVGRTAVLAPALTLAAARAGAPVVGLVDVGCSAGLNLRMDSYRMDYGSHGGTGPPDAPVAVTCEIVAGRPPIAPELPTIGERVGLDRDPIDVADDDATRWLLACTWPDTGRLERTARALAEARAQPPRLEAGDAVADLGRVVAMVPDGLLVVITTSWMLGYLSPGDRRAFGDAVAEASRGRRVAWISAEGEGVVERFDVEPPIDAKGTVASVLGLVECEGGAVIDAVHLGFVHPHGWWLDWRA